jgi:hypothetical protein
MLMIFLKVYVKNPAQSYLLMTQALLLQIVMRPHLSVILMIFNETDKWFHSNLLMLNYDKTYFFAMPN